MIYKLPQRVYPYEMLIEENARRRGSAAMEFELIDTGIFNDDRYFDIGIEYAKADVEGVLMRVTIHIRAPEEASIRCDANRLQPLEGRRHQTGHSVPPNSQASDPL